MPANSELSQEEADTLLSLPKRRKDDLRLRFPDLGGRLTAELLSVDQRELFLLDIGRSMVSLSKTTYQTRARTTFILARLDLDGAPHRNPDGMEIGCPHMHLYREGYADKWAFAVPGRRFRDLTDRRASLEDFMTYCNVVEPPEFDMGLLS